MRKSNVIIISDNIYKNKRIESILNDRVEFFISYSSVFGEDTEEICLIHNPDILFLCLNESIIKIANIVDSFKKHAQIKKIIIISENRYGDLLKSNIDDVCIVSLQNDYTDNELVELLDTIDLMSNYVSSQDGIDAVLHEYVPILRQHYLSKMLRHNVGDEPSIYKKFDSLCIELNMPYYVAVYGEITNGDTLENFEAVSFLIRTSIKDKLEEQGYQCYVFFDSDFNLNCIIGLKNTELEDDIEEKLLIISSIFMSSFDVNLQFGIGSVVSKLSLIHESYSAAKCAFLLAEKNEENAVLFSDIPQFEKYMANLNLFLSSVNEICKNDEIEILKEKINSIFSKDLYNAPIDIQKEFAIRFVFEFIKALKDRNIRVSKNLTLPVMISSIYSVDSPDKIKDGIYNILRSFEGANLLSDYNSQEKRMINEAKLYIDANICNPLLDLGLVSSKIGISKAYFCRLFHDNMGMSFSNYVRHNRMELAKKILKDNSLKTYEVAEKVGFASAKYFSSVFKEYTGYSPSEYQNIDI